MTADMKFDAHDAAAYVRAQVNEIASRVKDNPYATTEDARTALIATIGDIWPKATKKRTLRLSLIMALLGKSILTQNELLWHETKTLLEVLHDGDFERSCWEELQTSVEGSYFGEPWNFPATRIQ